MSQKRMSVSALALVIGLAGVANAQETAPIDQIETADEEEIVVTGSNIAGVESRAIPVDVYTAEDSYRQGNLSALEFTKNLSIVGSTLGESNLASASPGTQGSASINLRGVGAQRTLSIFNGRRFGANIAGNLGNDINMIPSIALSRTEILKDGGAVIYGSDAVGGVVNFITRENFDGALLSAEQRFIDGSDGDQNFSVLLGRNFDNGNILASYEFTHRSELELTERDWAIQPFARNSTPWAPHHNYGTWALRNASGATVGLVQDFTTDQCRGSNGPLQGEPQALGGLPVCWWNYAIHTANLVAETNQHRGYLQLHADLTGDVRFTGQLAYGKSEAPNIGRVQAFNVNVGPGPGTGSTFEFRVPSTNPYFASFLAQNASQVLVPTNTIAAADQFISIFFGPSGVPSGGLIPTSTQLENWNAVGSFEGRFRNFGGGWLDRWSASVTYNHHTSTTVNPDILGYRVQQALNGFGGPQCNAPDLVADRFDQAGLDANNNGVVSAEEFYAVVGTQNPGAAGQNGCMYLNPFSSNYAANGNFGTPNPRYISGNEVPADLARWLFDARANEAVTTDLTFDFLTSGRIPAFELPGGTIDWAVGAQWRQQEYRDYSPSPFMDPDTYPCPWTGQRPGDIGCPSGQGPLVFYTQNEDSRLDQQQYSYFGELRVPVLDTLSLQLAARREEFPQSGLGATVYKVAGIWEPLDWLALRASFGTNYSSPPSTLVPGQINTGINLVASAGNRFIRVQTETLGGIEPETAEVGNIGLIFDFASLPNDQRLRFSVDYFNIEVLDEIKTVSHNQILNTTFLGAVGGTQLINCSATLIERITFLNGPGAAGCAQGTTVGNDVTSIRSVTGNGPGISTAGIDYDLSYGFSALAGEFTASLSASQALEYEIGAFTLNNVTLQPVIDGLGFANYSRDGDIVSKWRGSASLNYNSGDHNIRYVMRYIQGVTDDRFIGTANEQIDDFLTHSVYYQLNLPFASDTALSLSVDNVTDEAPPFTVQQYSYDPAIGNPLGRTFEIGIRTAF